MTKHYIQWAYPGLIVSDTSEEEVQKRDVPPSEIPERAFGYRFFDQEESLVNGEVLTGKMKNEGPWHYFGKIKTVEEAVAEDPNSILTSNMEINGWDRVVMTKFGQAFPLEKGDKVIKEA